MGLFEELDSDKQNLINERLGITPSSFTYEDDDAIALDTLREKIAARLINFNVFIIAKIIIEDEVNKYNKLKKPTDDYIEKVGRESRANSQKHYRS